jgi:hypothetical protein
LSVSTNPCSCRIRVEEPEAKSNATCKSVLFDDGQYQLDCYHGDYRSCAQFLPAQEIGTYVISCTHHAHSNSISALVYGDLPYGLQIEGWDKRVLDKEELVNLFRQICANNTSPFHVVFVWINPIQVADVTEALELTGHDNIQKFYWAKIDNRPPTPAQRMASVVEMALVAYRKTTTNFSQFISLPNRIDDRHNIIFGPGLHRLGRDEHGKVINIHEKPPYVSEYVAEHFSTPGSRVMVLGSGAGGDVWGFVNAGRDVVAIEIDKKQYDSMHARALGYKPMPEIDLIISNQDLRMSKSQAKMQREDSQAGFCVTCLEAEVKTDEVRECPQCLKTFCETHWPEVPLEEGAVLKCPICGVPPEGSPAAEEAPA